MEQPRISVVVPVYNVEQYLDRCVNSIVQQTYRNLEILLVDDGSPDRCPQMCDAWAVKDQRIRVIHKENAGAGLARNTGIEAATGAYICFVDSDDYLDLTAIEKAYTALTEQNAEVAVFGLTRLNSRGVAVQKMVPVPAQNCYRGEEVQRVFLPDYIDSKHLHTQNQNLNLSACVCLFSMELIKRAAWRFVSEREVLSEDSYSLIWLFQYVQSVTILPESLYFYCENGSSQSRTYREDRFEKIKHFHAVCTEMAVRAGYGPDICARISGLLLSFSIAAMKQIVAADKPYQEKKALLTGIVCDALMQKILHDPACQYQSRFRNVLFRGMRRKQTGLVYCFVKLQLWKDGKC